MKIGSSRFSNIGVTATGLAILVLFAFTWFTLSSIKEDIRNRAGASLLAVLETTHQAFSQWEAEKEQDTLFWAQVPEVVALTEELLATERTPDALRRSPAQARIRALLKPIIQSEDFEGFFITAPDDISLASTRDENIGVLNPLISQPELLRFIRAGDTHISLPLRSDVPLPVRTGELVTGRLTMYSAAPMRNAAGEIIAMLTFRINPAHSFTSLFQAGRIGRSGETYAFDIQGTLLSESRFDTQLQRMGLIEPGQRGILNISIRDPGTNLLESGRMVEAQEQMPVTRLVRDTISGYSGVILQSYRDYRGVEVLGAGYWSDHRGLGMATEMDVEEVFQDYRITRAALITLSLLGCVVFAVLFFTYESKRRQSLRDQEKQRVLQLEYQGLFDNAEVAIWNENLTEVLREFERLRQAGERSLRSYLEANPQAVAGLWDKVRVHRVNEAALELVEASSEEDFIANYPKALASCGPEVFIDKMCALWRGERTFRTEAVMHTFKGQERNVLYSARFPTTVQGYDNVPVCIVDITDQKEAEARLIQASKLATLGEMTTSVAHELNQPLNVIKLAAGNLLRRIRDGVVDMEYMQVKLQRIDAQVVRAGAIIDHMRIFGRKSSGKPQSIDMRDVVRSSLDLVGEQLRLANIEIRLQLPEACPPVSGHQVQVEQVLLNLLTNARDAIQTREDNATQWINLSVESTDDEVSLIVEDNGGGIPKHVIDRIFEPFYTTKDIGKGTGLGLSVSYGIIHDMGGTLLASNAEHGARFVIRVPSVAHVAAMKAARAASEAALAEATADAQMPPSPPAGMSD